MEKGASKQSRTEDSQFRTEDTDLAFTYRDVLVWSLKESAKSPELTSKREEMRVRLENLSTESVEGNSAKVLEKQ